MVKHFADNINAELENSNITITQKLDRLFEILISSKLENTEFNSQLLNNFKTYYSMSNYVYLETMEKFSLTYFASIFSIVIKEGKLFDDRYDVDKIRRLERYIILAWESGATPVIILTKADLCDDINVKFLEVQQVALGIDVLVVSAISKEGINDILAYINPRETIAFIRSSGIGKSTLINTLLGNEKL